MNGIPTIFCINLDRSRDRRDRMTKRFESLNLKYQFVKGCDYRDPASAPTDMLHADWTRLVMGYKTPEQYAAERFCLMSHLLAVRQFVESGEEKGIIMEDDVCFHRDFIGMYSRLSRNIPEGTGIVLLSHMVENYKSGVAEWVGDDYNLLKVNPKALWGAQAYLIDRSKAESILDRFKSEPRSDMDYILSETIFRIEGTLVAYPVLLIEESLDSNIQTHGELLRHIQIFNKWGRDNYDV